MSLYDTKKDLTTYARMLPEIEVNGVKTRKYEDYNITVLADAYCDALDNKDETKISIYLAALLLRFWYIINKMYQQVHSYGYDHDDCFNRLYDCINVACKYRAWQNPDKHTNAQACINEAIWGRGAAMMAYEAKLQKAGPRATINLDERIDSDTNATRADLVMDESQNGDAEKAYDIVQDLLSQNLVVEAIIADNIANKDFYKVDKKIEIDEVSGDKTVKQTVSFWDYKLVQALDNLDEGYVKYFARVYAVDIDVLQLAVDALVAANHQKKYKFIDKSKLAIKQAAGL